MSRALAAYVVSKLAGVKPEEAAAAVTDGFFDNGIDAIAIVPDEARLVIAQSKWSSNGRGSASLDEMLKFREGLSDLVQLKWDSFNEKVTRRSEEIEQLLLQPSVSIDVVFAHMGTGALSGDVRRRMDEYLADMNDPSEIATFHYLGQAEIHRLLVEEQQAPRIDLTVELSDWGQVEGPPRAIYGQVNASEVASWLMNHGRDLLSKNVRVVLSDSEVNNSLVATVVDSPESFWYYNNGVTVLCDEIERAPAGGSDRRVGNFAFRGVSVVNGAQTVGSLARASYQGRSEELEAARVMVRFISLEETSPDFAREVTRATNTQNRIGGRDFLSLDPQQARLRDEFAVEGLRYVYRSGEADPRPEDGCSVMEATVAVACAQDTPSLATQAKREISRLWDDIDKAPYKQLFNSSTTYLRVWRSVQLMRVVEDRVSELKRAMEGRDRGVTVHGNRMLLYLVFRQLDMSRIDDPTLDWNAELDRGSGLVAETLQVMTAVAERDYPGYPASLFKNATKTAGLASTVIDELMADPDRLDLIP